MAWRAVPHRPQRRAVAWAALRELLVAEGHPHAVLSNPCPRCRGPHGPVQVSGAPWLASVSYAGAVAVVALCSRTDARGAVAAFAIDAEPLQDARRDVAGGAPGGLLRWVRTEAVLKADGRGLRVDREGVDITEGQDGWAARVPGARALFRGFEVDGLSGPPPPPGILVSVATATAGAAAAGRRARR